MNTCIFKQQQHIIFVLDPILLSRKGWDMGAEEGAKDLCLLNG